MIFRVYVYLPEGMIFINDPKFTVPDTINSRIKNPEAAANCAANTGEVLDTFCFNMEIAPAKNTKSSVWDSDWKMMSCWHVTVFPNVGMTLTPLHIGKNSCIQWKHWQMGIHACSQYCFSQCWCFISFSLFRNIGRWATNSGKISLDGFLATSQMAETH